MASISACSRTSAPASRANVSVFAIFALAGLALTGLAASGCSAPRGPEIVAPKGEVARAGGSDEYPLLCFADGQVSLNDRCIVRQRPLNPKMPPVYVNGRPVGFC